MKSGEHRAYSFDEVLPIHLLGKVALRYSTLHLWNEVVPHLVEKQQYQKYHRLLVVVPKTVATYPDNCFHKLYLLKT